MATYETLRGMRVKYLSADPTNPQTGQVWYNTTTSTLKSLVAVAAWASAATYFGNVGNLAIGGPQTAAMSAGGDYFTSTGGTYDGSAWTATTAMSVARDSCAGAKDGSQTAFWAAGGVSAPAANTTEEYDGSSWTAGGTMGDGRRLSGTAGALTTGLAFGGYSPGKVSGSEQYNGSAWTATPALGTAVYYNTGLGTQTAAISYGGNAAPPDTGITNTEEYDGSSWTALPASNYGRQQAGAHGNTADAYGYGGSAGPAAYFNTNDHWNGSSWTTSPATLIAAVRPWQGTGPTGPAGMTVGGYGPATPAGGSSTQEFNVATTTVNPNAWASGGTVPYTSRQNMSFGTQTAAINCGGYVSSTLDTAASYDGASWTASPALNVAARLGGVAGTQAAGLQFGGIQPPSTYSANVQTWNGSAWANSPYNLTNGTYGIMGCGTQTAALKVGGENPAGGNYDTSEEFDGEAWTAGGTMPESKYVGAGNGIQTSAIITGGSPVGTTTFEYNGAAWGAGGALSTFRVGTQAGSAGTALDSNIVFGGSTPANPNMVKTEGYDGSAWSTRGNLGTGRGSTNGNGTATAGLMVSGGPPSSTTTACEEFSVGTTSVAANSTLTTS